MTTQERANKDVIHRFIDEFVNEQNYALVDDIFTEEYTRHDPASPESESGPEPWVESMKGLHRAFPDAAVHVGELIAEGDLVSFEGTLTGTHRGAFRGIEPTGTSIEIQGNAMHRVRDGQIAETWATWDFLGLLTQLGVVEPWGSER
ncbi:ester cyclase [Haloarchaeobius baliensis]|uniref:ester cyclase n=1 Tax=Haloarchaeobius baliensis TaxID=1670458 RepID=UPI003F881FAC